MNEEGFTLIELMIIMAILGILLSAAISSYQDYDCRKTGNCSPESMNRVNAQKAKLNYTIDGTTCIGGYKFVGDKQLIGSNGGGVPCSEQKGYYEGRQ